MKDVKALKAFVVPVNWTSSRPFVEATNELFVPVHFYDEDLNLIPTANVTILGYPKVDVMRRFLAGESSGVTYLSEEVLQSYYGFTANVPSGKKPAYCVAMTHHYNSESGLLQKMQELINKLG